MRDIFDELFKNEPIDPVEAARRSVRPQTRKRFYKEVGVTDGGGAFALTLDGRGVRTPARRPLAAPCHGLAEALAAEWRAQDDFIQPAAMPLTRLANAIIDGVAVAAGPVAAEIGKYLGSDLVFYRASTPEGLVASQKAAWDPLIEWAREALGAHFAVTESLSFVAQPEAALAAARAAIPGSAADPQELWRLGALHSITTLTGSALIALAVLHGRVTAEQAWASAHVDEDWNMEFWGRDTLALERRAQRFMEMQAAATVMRLVGRGFE